MTRVKEIPKKNYMILAAIIFFTLAVAITTYIVYNNQKNYENNIPVIRGKMSEIEAKDIDEYLRENPNSLLYIGVASDSNSRHLEEKLLNLKDRKNLDILYVNISNLDNKKVFYEIFNRKYGNGYVLSNYPAFIIIRDGKVFDMRERTNNDLYIGDIEQLIDVYEIEGTKND